MVIAVPGPLVVERHQEDVGLLEALERLLAVDTAGQRVAERAREPIEHRGPREKLAVGGVEPRQDLVGDVVQDMAVARRKVADATRDVRLAGQREARQLQHRGPALGPRHERVEVVIRQLHAHPVREEDLRLLLGEEERVGPKLEELAVGPQPRERQARVLAGRDHQVGLGGQALEQGPDGAPDVRGSDHVVVVEHEHPRLGSLGQEQGDLVDDVIGLRPGSAFPDCPGPVAAEHGGARPEVSKEASGIVVRLDERDPRGRSLGCRQPIGEGRRLPEARRGRHEGQPGIQGAGKVLDQARPTDPPPRGAGRRQSEREKTCRHSCHCRRMVAADERANECHRKSTPTSIRGWMPAVGVERHAPPVSGSGPARRRLR